MKIHPGPHRTTDARDPGRSPGPVAQPRPQIDDGRDRTAGDPRRLFARGRRGARGGDLDRIVLLNTLPPPRLDPEVLERHVEVREGGFGEPTVLGESLGLTVGHRLNVGVIETVPRQPPESAARRPLSFEEGEEANIPPI